MSNYIFRLGVADGLLRGYTTEDFSLSRNHFYKEGYDFGVWLYTETFKEGE